MDRVPDAVHEHLAARGIYGALVMAVPHLRPDVPFGAAACVHLDAVAAQQMLDAWADGRSAPRVARDREVA